MKLSISNIAWSKEDDAKIYNLLKINKFSGLEIAPTRIFPENPYEKIKEATYWSKTIYEKFGITVSSMQSIWYGKNENIFGSEAERVTLFEYTKKAIDFAKAIDCKNLVFGCPKNRNMPETASPQTAVALFEKIGNYAEKNAVVVAIEPNPTIYGTNFINTTKETFDFVKLINNEGIKVNIDCGTIIENQEKLDILRKSATFINHFHISEPNLQKIQNRAIHKELASILREINYEKFVSIEMKNFGDIDLISNTLNYVKGIFL